MYGFHPQSPQGPPGTMNFLDAHTQTHTKEKELVAFLESRSWRKRDQIAELQKVNGTNARIKKMYVCPMDFICVLRSICKEKTPVPVSVWKSALTSNSALVTNPCIISFLFSMFADKLQQNAGICMLSSCVLDDTIMEPRDNISSSNAGTLENRQCILQINCAGTELCVLLGP